MREGFSGIISPSPVSPGKCSVQEEQRQRPVDLEQNSGGEETCSPGGVPTGHPIRPETVCFPGQLIGRIAHLAGERPALPEERQKIRRTVPERLELSGERFEPGSKLLIRLSGNREKTRGIQFIRRSGNCSFPDFSSHHSRNRQGNNRDDPLIKRDNPSSDRPE